MEATAPRETTLKSTAQEATTEKDAAVQESERVTHKVVNKDWKKVEAGRKGAAARKAKHKALLEQLRKAEE